MSVNKCPNSKMHKLEMLHDLLNLLWVWCVSQRVPFKMDFLEWKVASVVNIGHFRHYIKFYLKVHLHSIWNDLEPQNVKIFRGCAPGPP